MVPTTLVARLSPVLLAAIDAEWDQNRTCARCSALGAAVRPIIESVRMSRHLGHLCGTRNYGARPEGQFALACLEDFLLARTPVARHTGSQSPVLLASDLHEASRQSVGGNLTAALLKRVVSQAGNPKR